jgi:hypothetical protein
MGLLRVNVLGPPEVFHDERRLSFALRKATLAALIMWDFCSHTETEALLRGGDERQA